MRNSEHDVNQPIKHMRKRERERKQEADTGSAIHFLARTVIASLTYICCHSENASLETGSCLAVDIDRACANPRRQRAKMDAEIKGDRFRQLKCPRNVNNGRK